MGYNIVKMTQICGWDFPNVTMVVSIMSEYMLLYVGDCLCVSEHPPEPLMRVGNYFTLKPDSAGQPKVYLGGKLSQVQLLNNVNAWVISASHYI